MRRARHPAVLDEARRQLEAYFNGTLKQFDLPLQRRGSRFQNMVRSAVEDIRFGEVRSYQAIADRIGGRAIARTVGNACGSNLLPILVPCHRVIASNGLLTGYVGGLWRKRWLLEHEGVLTPELY
jgi:methylated-DNA-[protein]-cysteine S-methyltransferase